MHLDPDLHPDERDTKTNRQTDGRTNIEIQNTSTQKAPKGAIILSNRISFLFSIMRFICHILISIEHHDGVEYFPRHLLGGRACGPGGLPCPLWNYTKI